MTHLLAPLTTLAWPLPNLVSVAGIWARVKGKKDKQVRPPLPDAAPYMDIEGHASALFGALRAFLMATVLFYVFHDDSDPEKAYPAFGRAGALKLDWVVTVAVRNILATWIICGSWDWLLYFSPMSKALEPYKINPRYPSMAQFRHDALNTTIASLCGTAVEVCLCHAWATGMLSFNRNLSDAPFTSAAWVLFNFHVRIPHFYIIHRLMHPWKNKTLERWGIPDVGKFLYRHVHSLHHKSHNPSAFSGTSMHPVEATAYYTASIVPALFGAHPIISIACLIDCAVGAWCVSLLSLSLPPSLPPSLSLSLSLSLTLTLTLTHSANTRTIKCVHDKHQTIRIAHDGFAWPGGGDLFHQLHHQHFDCNFGASHVPIDWMLGTYAGSKEEVRAIWK